MNDTTNSIAFLNGEYLPLSDAHVPVLDRGFLFADGVYEVIPVYGGHLFRLDQHLKRLEQSLHGIRLSVDMSYQDWRDMLDKLLQLNPPASEQSIYLQVTRGSSANREHTFPAVIKPTLFAFCSKLTAKDINELAKGTQAITMPDPRWKHCEIKAISLLANVLLRQQAVDENAGEAILIRDGYALEGSSSNLFIVNKDTITTPPLSSHILNGVTRDLVIELAKQHDVAIEERPIPEAELHNAEEIWITSSTKKILPVLKLNKEPVGCGQAGPVWRRMIKHYHDYKDTLIGKPV